MKKRTAAWILVALMIFAMLPQGIALAEEQPKTIKISEKVAIKSYYAPISSNSELEDEIVNSILSHSSTIDLRKYEFTVDEAVMDMKGGEVAEYLQSLYPELDLQIYADKYPDLYNLKEWGYIIEAEIPEENSDSNPNNDVPLELYVGSISLSYNFTHDDYINRNNQYKAVAASMVADLVDSRLSDLEKALILHDRLALHCEYDYENYRNNRVPADSYNMYGALVKKIAVCEGYSKAYQYMLSLLGIESRVCSSEKLKHMWNIVTIDGVEYHVDVTQDDPVYNLEGRVNHDNFLRSSEGIYEVNHPADDYDVTPNDTRYDHYFWQNSKTAFQYVNGNIYYIDNSSSDLMLWEGESRSLLWDIDDKSDGHIKLNSYKNTLYYAFEDKVYSLDTEAEEPSSHGVYIAELPKGYHVYGFNIIGNEFLLECYDNPNGGKPYTIKEKIEDEIDVTSELSSALKSAKKSFTYDGKEKTLSITVKLWGGTLVKNRDYTEVYKSNVNAGTASVTLKAQNGYKGTASITFTIKPASFSRVKVSNIYDKEYTGSAITQSPVVYLGEKLMQPKVDYTVSYSSNKATGKAAIKITAKGNYSGTVTKYFYIHPKKVTGLKVSSATATSVKLKWSKISSGTGYAVRRRNSKKGSYKTIAIINSLKTTSYTDKTVKANHTYYYDVVSFKTVSGKKYGSVASALVTAKTATATPNISYYKNKSSGKATIKWGKVSGATKYELYMSTKKTSGYKRIYSGTKTSYTKTKLKKGKTYYFKVRTYRSFDGDKLYSSYSSVKKLKINK